MNHVLARLLRLLRAERRVLLRDVDLPCAFASLVHLPADEGPLVLLDRAGTSPRAERAIAAIDPRFVLEASRIAAHDEVVMPWDDTLRPPTRVARARRTLHHEGAIWEDEGAPFALVRELLAAAEGSASDEAAGVPFLSGFVGFFGYGAASFVDTFHEPARPREATPDLSLLFADTVLFTDDAEGTRATLAVVGRGLDRGEAERDAEARLARANTMLRRVVVPPAPRSPVATVLRSSYTEASYAALVERAKAHLVAGDAFQLCLTHRITVTPPPPSPAHLYAALRGSNPAPFAAFVRVGDVTVVSSSPERFVRVAEGVVEARPIKGTRPRGETDEQDRALAAELSASEKDGAENDMIVDLLRNDLAKVSVPGSVEVRERRIVEAHPTVHQLVSTIVSRLLPGATPLDLLLATFPGGSMTGAPKVSAVDRLAALEPHERGVYSGALGYLDPRGRMDLSIVIRSFVITAREASFGVGGGIVLDSDPRAEWRETLDKGRALVAALSAALDEPLVWPPEGPPP